MRSRLRIYCPLSVEMCTWSEEEVQYKLLAPRRNCVKFLVYFSYPWIKTLFSLFGDNTIFLQNTLFFGQ
jgi:hypothetical protein